MNEIDFFDLCHHLVDICGKSLLKRYNLSISLGNLFQVSERLIYLT